MPRGQLRARSTGDGGAGGSGGRGKQSSRQSTLVACARCKRFKKRCDGGRPACNTCQLASKVCEYDTESPAETRVQALRRRHDDVQAMQSQAHESIDWLRSQTPTIALACLQRLRNARDPLYELCSIATADRMRRVPTQPSVQEHLVASSSFIKDARTAEIVTRNAVSYPPFAEVEARLVQDGSSRRRGTSRPSSADSSTIDQKRNPTLPRAPVVSRSTAPRTAIESCLRGLRIRYWTTVPISDDLAAKLISAYLRVEQPVYGFVDADLFIRDLMSHQLDHCSALLVNAILFWASCTFEPIYPGSSTLSQAFLTATQRLLDGEHSQNTELTVASLMVLTISTICYGRDESSKQYMLKGIHMAEDLCLTGKDRRGLDHFDGRSPESLSMLCHVAWGTFNLSTILAMHFHDLSSGTFTRFPPLLPTPGSSAWATASSPRNSMSSVLPSPYLGSTYPSFCEFWTICHEIASVFYTSSGPVDQHVPLAFAESSFRRLLAWAEKLPPGAHRCEDMTHNVVEMHICYHATIMDLFRPFLTQNQLLATFSASPRRPEAIFMLSLGHLRSLVTYYHTRYAGLAELYTISWIHGPLYVAPAILRYERRDGWEADFLACMDACAGLLQVHNVMEGFLRALLGMAVTAGALSISQARESLDNLRARPKDGVLVQYPQVGFVVDQDLALGGYADAVGDVLAQRFDEMLFRDDPFERGVESMSDAAVM